MKYKKSKIKWLGTMLLAVVIAGLGSCYYDKEELLYPGTNQPVDCGTISAKFSANVLPLVTAKCATSGCHDASASGGLILQNYTQISSAASRINVRAVTEKTMPQAGPLATEEINILKCWIESGAPNN